MFHTTTIKWHISKGLTPYNFAINRMEELVEKIDCEKDPEQIWLLEHPPLFTAGTSAKPEELLKPDRFHVHATGRGGKYTYHGPGQRIAYVMLDLKRREKDVRLFVSVLEQWIINTLEHFNVRGERRKDRVGVWVTRPDKPQHANGNMHEDKIAAIGIRIRRWVTFHGIAINVNPELEHFSGIIPCGISGDSNNYGVTSLTDLGLSVTMGDVDIALKQEFEKLFV